MNLYLTADSLYCKLSRFISKINLFLVLSNSPFYFYIILDFFILLPKWVILFQFCGNNSCRSWSLFLRFVSLFYFLSPSSLEGIIREREQYRKEAINQYKKINKSDNYCQSKVGRVISIWGAIDISIILR